MGHRMVALAVLVAALLGLAAVGADAAAVKAPVINQSFTPLPCTHDGTTLGEEGCAEKSILRGDRQIDRLNASIFEKLNAAGRRDFIAGHKAWFKYRQAYCRSEGDIYQGGTEAGVLEARCAADVDTAHVKELKGFLSNLSQE